MVNRKFTVVACLNRAYPLKIAHSRERISIREYTIRVPANRETFDCQSKIYTRIIYTRIYSGKNLTRKVNSILKNLISIHAYIQYICFSKKSNFQIFITSSYISYKRFHLENILRIYRNENNINIFTNILCTEN